MCLNHVNLIIKKTELLSSLLWAEKNSPEFRFKTENSHPCYVNIHCLLEYSKYPLVVRQAWWSSISDI